MGWGVSLELAKTGRLSPGLVGLQAVSLFTSLVSWPRADCRFPFFFCVLVE